MKSTERTKNASHERRRPYSRRFRRHFFAPVAIDIYLELELMLITFATGIMDAITFPDFHVFASNQTGNTALLAIGALRIAPSIVSLPHIGLSLGAFLAGGLLFGQIGNFCGRLSRPWLITTNLVQTALVFLAAALRAQQQHTAALVDTTSGNSNGNGNFQSLAPESSNPPTDAHSLAIITCLALASGAQVASARTVRIPEITTAMVTSAYIDFIVDPDLLRMHNRPRNRRLGFVAALVLGSFVGAIAYRFGSPGLALYLSGVGKAVASVALMFNPVGIIECHGDEDEATGMRTGRGCVAEIDDIDQPRRGHDHPEPD